MPNNHIDRKSLPGSVALRLFPVVFSTGFSIMVLELVGARVVAPHLGTSVYIWTALIGVILGCLSLGYWLGGVLADAIPTPRSWFGLTSLLSLSALGVVWSVITADFWLSLVSTQGFELRAAATLAAALLFGPASILMAMITPYAARMLLDHSSKTGTTVGRLYAASTLGSIVGTFATGFWLFSWLRTDSIIILIGSLLLCLSLIVLTTTWKHHQAVLRSFWFFCLVVFPIIFSVLSIAWIAVTTSSTRITNATSAHLLEHVSSPYQDIFIFEVYDEKYDSQRKIMSFGHNNFQSSQYQNADGGGTKKTEYITAFRIMEWLRTDTNQAIMIGGGGLTFVPYFLDFFPETSSLSVVEIDPVVTELAQKNFDVPSSSRVQIAHEDGRVFLNQTAAGEHQVILLDAFGHNLTPPFHLVTAEAAAEMFRVLDDEGLVVANVPSSITGPNNAMIRDVATTFNSVFPEVRILRVNPKLPTDQPQSLLLVASKSSLSEKLATAPDPYRFWLEQDFTATILENNQGVLLTDALAPVEKHAWLLHQTMHQSSHTK